MKQEPDQAKKVLHSWSGLVGAGTGPEEVEQAAEAAVQAACQQAAPAGDEGPRPLCRWQQLQQQKGGAELVHLHPVCHVAWHGRGDYFASVAPTGERCNWLPCRGCMAVASLASLAGARSFLYSVSSCSCPGMRVLEGQHGSRAYQEARDATLPKHYCCQCLLMYALHATQNQLSASRATFAHPVLLFGLPQEFSPIVCFVHGSWQAVGLQACRSC